MGTISMNGERWSDQNPFLGRIPWDVRELDGVCLPLCEGNQAYGYQREAQVVSSECRGFYLVLG